MQNALTVIVKIKSDKAQHLEQVLLTIGNDIKGNHTDPDQRNTYIKLGDISSLHFGRWAMIPNDETGQKEYLLFTSNFDGSLKNHLNEFVDKAGEAMDTIWSCCDGYPEGRTANLAKFKQDFKKFIVKHSYDYAAFYKGYRDKPVKTVRRNRALRQKFETYLDKMSDATPLPDKLQTLANEVDHVRGHYETRIPLKITLWQWLMLILDFIRGFVTVFLYHPIKRRILQREPALNLRLIDDGVRVREGITDIEDVVTQNQVTIISRIDGGFFATFKTRLVLLAINIAARQVFYKGALGGISTIHFARWVIVDNGRYLMFTSNYDGSWPSYIGDFVDKGARPMDLIWNSAPHYPIPGSINFERFKDIIRRNQIRTQVFYSAHPDVTIKNILSDGRIAAAIDRHGGDAWLQ